MHLQRVRQLGWFLPPDALVGAVSRHDGKRARKAHDEYTKVSQALDEKYYPGTPAGSKGPVETPTMRHGPSATHPRAHEVAGFGVGAFGELSAGCSKLCNLVSRVWWLTTWRIMATRHPRRPLTRSDREFGACGG